MILILAVALASTDVVQKFEETKSAILQDELRSREIMSELYESGKRLKKINEQRGQLQREIQYLEERVRGLATELLQVNGRLKAQRKVLQSRLRTALRLNEGGAFQFLFSAKNSNELMRKLQILKKVSQQDAELVRKFQETRDELTSLSQKFQKDLQELKNMQQEHLQKESALAMENTQKQKLLRDIQKLKNSKLSTLAQLRSTGLVDSLVQPSLLEAKGKLQWPARGQIARTYGPVQDGTYQFVLPHSGVFLSTNDFSEVKSVFPGEVVFAGPLKGFDQTVVLDHGDHYYSVYASLRSVNVRLKDRVQKNQTIAHSGYSSWHKSHGVYFEIRYFSEPENPLHWMKGKPL